jgi:hypothetical protein
MSSLYGGLGRIIFPQPEAEAKLTGHIGSQVMHEIVHHK